MRLSINILTCLALLPGVSLAQKWEFGGSAGYTLYRDVAVSSPSVSARAGFEPGFAAGALLGNDLYRFLGGEVRYTFISDDLRVSSGATKVTFGGQSHAIHYDFLIHAGKRDAAVRPFFAAGSGVKFYRGTGTEQVYQPLGNVLVLSRTSQLEPLVSVGGGVKFRLSPRALLRLDFRDYMTPSPDHLFAAPPTGLQPRGWFHDFVVMVGISTTFTPSEGVRM